MTLGPAQWILVIVALQRLGELLLARRNTARLKAEGGYELGAGHYPIIVGLHAALLVVLFLAVDRETPILWAPFALFLLLQVARLWVIASLGRYWTTRIIAVPHAPLVRRGPYRWVRHPNYLIVIAEIAVLPLVFGLWPIALAFSLLNLPVIAWRIRIENAALAARS